MKTETEVQTRDARATCYRFLSACYCLPEDGVLELKVFAVVCETLEALGSDAVAVATLMGDAFEQTAFEDMRIEYSRLFVGPFSLPAPPYGSVYLDKDRRLMGDSTLDVVKRYQAAGVDADPVQEDVPDHIAIELEFMGYLVHLEAKAAASGDAAGVRDALGKQESFLDKHLCAWVPEFARAVKADTESAFYSGLVDATTGFLAEDLARVREARESL